ncbi:retrovirus-related pol polyprotein from transposon TNT 1-94 [Tanacetum coccineum]
MCVLHYINGVNFSTKHPIAVPFSTRESKRTVNQFVATLLKRTVSLESTSQKPRSKFRKQYEQISKTCKWWYSKITPPGYKWKPKTSTVNVKPNVSMPLGNKSRTTTILEPTTLRKSTISNTPSSSNSSAARRDNSIRHRLWVLKAHDGKSQASKYTWTHFLRSKDETLEVLIDFLKLVQRGLHAQVRTVRTDKGTKFLNKNLHAYFAQEGIEHQMSTARTPEQNGVVEQNHTLVEAARTMLSAAKVPLFFWAEAIATTCFTQNRSLIIPRHEKTPYHIINGRKPFVKFIHIFGSLCYIVRDGENLDKMKEKGDACIFVGLSPGPQSQENVPQAAETVKTSNELDLLFSLMFDELLNGTTQVVSKSSAITTADAPNHRQQQHITPSTSTTVDADKTSLNIQTTPETTSQAPPQAPTVTATENINQAETNKENAQVEEDEFINIFSTPIHEQGETCSQYVDSSNMHTFYQRHPSEHRWTKDHP